MEMRFNGTAEQMAKIIEGGLRLHGDEQSLGASFIPKDDEEFDEFNNYWSHFRSQRESISVETPSSIDSVLMDDQENAITLPCSRPSDTRKYCLLPKQPDIDALFHSNEYGLAVWSAKHEVIRRAICEVCDFVRNENTIIVPNDATPEERDEANEKWRESKNPNGSPKYHYFYENGKLVASRPYEYLRREDGTYDPVSFHEFMVKLGYR